LYQVVITTTHNQIQLHKYTRASTTTFYRTMEGYNFTLEKYNGIKSRYACPECGQKNQFAKYVDAEGNYIAEHVGRCNRESKCGYHMKPKEYFQNNPASLIQHQAQVKSQPRKQIEYVPTENLKATLKAYENNSFVIYLNTLFTPEIVQSLIDAYGLGTTKDGSCIFWQVDDKGLIRTGKVIRYGDNGHRDKTSSPYFIHTKLNIKNIEQCLFGQHLLNELPIGIVESEKTAVIMAGVLPDYTWMATGGKTSGLLSKLSSLKGRKVICFPDSDAFNEWTEKLSAFGFSISDALNKHLSAEEQGKGLDLADFVTKADNYFETLKDGRVIEINVAGYPAEWI
jgi:hypothetical protein